METMTIFGPPGTGKTRTLVEFALRDSTPANSVFISYTRAAAAEALQRFHGDSENSVRTSTLHSLAYRALNVMQASVIDWRKLREFAKTSGIPFKGSEEGLDQAQEGDEYMGVLSYARNTKAKSLEPVYDRFGRPGTAARFQMFVEAYRAWKAEFGYWDFDDMLFHFANAKRLPAGPAYVFLDEAQDCSPLQWDAVRQVCRNATHVFTAGDDDQAIYEWSGADPHGMVSFMEETKGEMMVLAQSYRLPIKVHKEATQVIRPVKRRVDKVFRPEDRYGTVNRWGDIAMIDFKIGFPKGALILARDRFRLSEIQQMLNQDLIPYDVAGGMSPWTSKVAKALKSGEAKLDDVPPAWREFYHQADLSQPIKFHLSTVHSAKGREHEYVVVDLSMPARVLNNLQVDEDAERRVQYVALSRAKSAMLLCGENPLV